MADRKLLRLLGTGLYILLLCVSCVEQKGKPSDGTKAYLKKVWEKVGKIQSASYYEDVKSWEPGDTIPTVDTRLFFKEYVNPSDTTIGSSYVSLEGSDTTLLEYGYNGEVKVTTYHEHKGIVIDDFTRRNSSYRPVSPPFFNYTQSIIGYILNTTDSISLEMEDLGDQRHVRLVVHEDQQVEFFGKAYYMPKPPFERDPTSIYELWIRKSDDLPCQYRREMAHNISAGTCVDPEFNWLSLSDFNLFDYFPKGYEIRRYGEKKERVEKSSLIGMKVPNHVLKDADGKSFSLSDFDRSRVLLVQLTGIGCGACMVSIPFLNSLKQKYKAEDLDVVAIDTWMRKEHTIRNYIERHQIGYTFLAGDEAVMKFFQTGGAAPFFFVLDRQRVIRNIFRGYQLKESDAQITAAIDRLLTR
ncbi:TlpA family protein disulfide reductase [Parabacteroides sp.]